MRWACNVKGEGRRTGIFFMNTTVDVLVGDELWRLDRDDILASYIISRTFLSFIRILSSL